MVRLTGSGLGCDDWPNCNDERFIDVSTGHAAIEQVNRLLSGLIGVPTLFLAIVGFRAARRGAGLRWPAVGVLVSVLANGVVGGIAVRGDLHPALVQSHFLLAMASIAFGLVAIRQSGPDHIGQSGPDHIGRRPIEWRHIELGDPITRIVGLLGVLVMAALSTGTVVTGAGPHAGEVDVRRFGFDIGNVARFHSVTVIAAVAVAAVGGWHLTRRPELASLQAPMSTWLFVAFVQGGIGYAQYFTGVPELLVGAHIAGATLLWVLTIRLVLATLDATGFERVHDRNVDAQTFAKSHRPVV